MAGQRIRIAASALVAAVVAGVVAGAASAQEVRVAYVEATDPAGRPVTDLDPDAFLVTESGREARVLAVRSAREPMKIALLVDNGASMRAGHAVVPLRNAVAAFLEALPPQHAVSLITIGGQVRRRVDFTTDRRQLVDAGRSLFADEVGGVRFVDGIRETLDRRYEGDEAWPVFVSLLGDGPEASAFLPDWHAFVNSKRYRRFVNGLRAAGVMVHTVQWSAAGRNRPDSATDFAVDLTENTAGRYAAVVVATRMADEMARLATDIGAHHDEASNLYIVAYERPDPPGDSVTVRVQRPAVALRAFSDRRLDR
jgi:hypothetical protein